MNERLKNLLERLVASGPKCDQVSASECHKIAEGGFETTEAFESIADELGVPHALPPKEVAARCKAAIASLREGLPYPVNEGKTHYDGCYTQVGHHNCAVRRIHELGQEIVGLVGEIQTMRDQLGLKPGDPAYTLNFNEEGGLDVVEIDVPRVEKH